MSTAAEEAAARVLAGQLPAELLARITSVSPADHAAKEHADNAMDYVIAHKLWVFPTEPAVATPYVEWWTLTKPPTAKDIARWWGQWPNADIACVPSLSGHFVLLFVGEDGADSLEAIEEEFGPLQPSHDFTTRWGNRLLFFEGSAPSSAGKLGPGTFTIGASRHVFLPPSLSRIPEEME
jgi:Bifunctional DNA primase/polymerase, N-terminal